MPRTMSQEKKALLEQEKEGPKERQMYGCVNDVDGSHTVEPLHQYKARWKSIRVLYLTMCFSSIEFAIVMSSLWPYLQKVDPKVNTTFLGWTNSGFSLCQMLGSLFLGIWCQYRPAIQPILFSIMLMSVGSLLYGYACSFHHDGLNMILVARLLLGLSAGNVAVCRAVLSQTTTLKERAKAFANLAMWQGIGFAFGPAMQVAAIPIGSKGIHIRSLKMTLDVFTAPGFLGFVMALVNFLAIIIWFKEFDIDIYEGKKPVNIDKDNVRKPDTKALLVTSTLFFVLFTVFALNETILTPLVMDEFAWTDIQTILYGGIILSVSGLIAVACFHIVKLLSSRYNERSIIAGGLVFILIGFIIYLPWGNKYPTLQVSKLVRHGNETMTELTIGCPLKFKWCKTQPKLYLAQFLTAATAVGIGYPIGFLAVNTLYSKLLGPRQQGGYMAWISAIGSLARVIGPLLVANAYVNVGPRWTFLIVDVILAFSILLLGSYYHRLVPFHEYMRNSINVDI